MENANKPKVFVITPFSDDFLALYAELKRVFCDDFEFTNAGDLDNQQNILKDIVEGINQASVVIADLTGLNPNVFYELGLAHAMDKKVIIITQNLGELPFDIKSYRANEYSLQFNKLPKLIDELKKLLFGAITGELKYGNPVSDYIPNFPKENFSDIRESGNVVINGSVQNENKTESVINENNEDKGFFDYITDINENSSKMTNEIITMSDELHEMSGAFAEATNDVERVKSQSGNMDVTFLRNRCRKLSSPVDVFSGKLKIHIENISKYWNVVENSFLSLLDNPYTKKEENISSLKENKSVLMDMKSTLKDNDSTTLQFIFVLRSSMGLERRLTKAIDTLIREFEEYLSMTETMASSIDRIVTKCSIVIDALES